MPRQGQGRGILFLLQFWPRFPPILDFYYEAKCWIEIYLSLVYLQSGFTKTVLFPLLACNVFVLSSLNVMCLSNSTKQWHFGADCPFLLVLSVDHACLRVKVRDGHSKLAHLIAVQQPFAVQSAIFSYLPTIHGLQATYGRITDGRVTLLEASSTGHSNLTSQLVKVWPPWTLQGLSSDVLCLRTEKELLDVGELPHGPGFCMQ